MEGQSGMLRAKDLKRICHEVGVPTRYFTIRKLAPILQSNSRRPAPLMRAVDEVPSGRVQAV